MSVLHVITLHLKKIVLIHFLLALALSITAQDKKDTQDKIQEKQVDG